MSDENAPVTNDFMALNMFSDSVPGDETRVPLKSNDGKTTRYYIFGPLKGDTLNGYRQRASGVGRKAGSMVAAYRYVFERCFRRVESPIESEKASGDGAKEALLKLADTDGRYAVLIDRVTQLYMAEVYPMTEVEEDLKG